MDESAKIKELEEELSKTPYNKRTQHHVGLIKAKIAKLKDKSERKERGKGISKGFAVKKTGDATVVVVGLPSVGKSTLLNKITSAKSKIGSYDFTTLDVIPGILEYEGARIQILDIPGVIRGASHGKGEGKEALSITRVADLILILIDVNGIGQLDIVKKELYEAGIRINQKKPDITIMKTSTHGLIIGKIRKINLSDETIEGILRELGIMNAEVIIREEITEDQLIDVIEANKIYLPAVIALNKIDLVDSKKLTEIKAKSNPDICISSEKNINIEKLKEMIFLKLDLVRVYCKQIGKKPDFSEPLIMKNGSTVEDVCRKLHRDFINRFRFVRIWGKSAKFPGQKFSLAHELADKDVVEIHLK